MQTFENTVTIARPAREVFAFLADLRNIPRWNYAIARTVPTSPGPPGAGAAYRQTRTIPRRSEESLQITVFQPPTRRTVQGQLGPFRATASYLLEPVPSGTRLANDAELEPISALLGRSARWRYQESRPGWHVTRVVSSSFLSVPKGHLTATSCNDLPALFRTTGAFSRRPPTRAWALCLSGRTSQHRATGRAQCLPI